MCVTTCPGLQSMAWQLGFEPVTCWSEVQHPTWPPSHTVLWLIGQVIRLLHWSRIVIQISMLWVALLLVYDRLWAEILCVNDAWICRCRWKYRGVTYWFYIFISISAASSFAAVSGWPLCSGVCLLPLSFFISFCHYLILFCLTVLLFVCHIPAFVDLICIFSVYYTQMCNFYLDNFCSTFVLYVAMVLAYPGCCENWPLNECSGIVVYHVKASSSAVDSSNCMLSSPLMNTERSLAILLGLHAHYQLRSTALSTEECQYSRWLQSQFFVGGLQTLHVQNPYEEEKGESRTPTSCATTPG